MRVRASFLALSIVAAACSTDGSDTTQLLVSAAASLTDAFAAVEEAYEETHRDVDVVLNLGGSSTLREQILEGAPADVFASANPSNMEELVAAGAVVGVPQVFARNRMQIAVPAGNPAGVTGLEDFADEQLLIGLCAEGVPCGDFARQALAAAGVVPSIDSSEPDVRALLTKIEAGELDAGITYVTDVAAAAGAVDGIAIAEAVNVVASYPVAVVGAGGNPEEAAAFVEFVLSPAGQEILASYGFASP